MTISTDPLGCATAIPTMAYTVKIFGSDSKIQMVLGFCIQVTLEVILGWIGSDYGLNEKCKAS